jgi:hypothetical protein
MSAIVPATHNIATPIFMDNGSSFICRGAN